MLQFRLCSLNEKLWSINDQIITLHRVNSWTRLAIFCAPLSLQVNMWDAYVTAVGKTDTDVSIFPALSNLSLPGGQQVKDRASRFTSHTATVVSGMCWSVWQLQWPVISTGEAILVHALMAYVGMKVQLHTSVAYRGGGGSPPSPEIPKAHQNRAKLNPIVKTVKNCWI